MTAKRKYLVELTFGKFTNGYKSEKTVIFVDAFKWDERTYVTRFVIPSKLLTFVLFGKKSFREIGCLKLSHNSPNGDIFISKLEIQEPKSPICTTAVINQFIREWTPNSKPISVKTIQLKKDKTLIECLIY